MASFRALSFARRPFTTSSLCRKEVDLVTSAYLNKVREVVGKQSELLNSPQLKKELNDQLNRLAQKFHLPDADAITKLNLQFEKANVISSVDQLADGGQSVEAQLNALNDSRAKYEAEQKAKKQAEQERMGAISGDADYAKEFFPIPPPHIEAQQLAAAAKAAQ
ncbi:hypothetical protein niasHT_002731 [Heterodera trifolii]|uniref:ATP synthase-coupling factor 6, mitochondrial n=1 Tax=Heterodera trifolii TaxID=157864 RepID=A0ABD2MBD3_9BILA